MMLCFKLDFVCVCVGWCAFLHSLHPIGRYCCHKSDFPEVLSWDFLELLSYSLSTKEWKVQKVLSRNSFSAVCSCVLRYLEPFSFLCQTKCFSCGRVCGLLLLIFCFFCTSFQLFFLKIFCTWVSVVVLSLSCVLWWWGMLFFIFFLWKMQEEWSWKNLRMSVVGQICSFYS